MIDYYDADDDEYDGEADEDGGGTRAAAENSRGIRLQKVLASAGVGSRRHCETLIATGHVTVDGIGVAELGTRVDPDTAVVRVDGKRLNLRVDLVYLVLNKPRGVVTAMSDPHGRRCVGDLVAGRPERLFHVGRLDADTEGLLVLTNDGDFAQRLSHPSHGVVKTYVAEVEGTPAKGLAATLRAGVELDDGPVSVDGFRVLDSGRGRSLVEVSLHVGRNQIVRRLLAQVGHPVLKLVRISIGPVRLGELRSGATRDLTAAELSELFDLVGL